MAWLAASVIGSAVIGAYGSTQASNSAEEQATQNRADQLAWNKQQDPFSAGGNREQYVPQLNQLMQGGISGVASDPAYKRFNDKSQEDLQRRMSASGQGASGQEMVALQENNQNNMMSYFDQQYRRLSDLSGASRGGGGAVRGQDPSSVYNQEMGRYENLASGFGGVTRLFGNGSSSSNFSNQNINSAMSSDNPEVALNFLRNG